MNAGTIGAALAAAALLAGCGGGGGAAGAPTPAVSIGAATTRATSSTPAPAPAPSGPTLTPAQINLQDHPPASLVHSQDAAKAERPMLAALPLTDAGVTTAIEGLAADGRTELTVTTTAGLGRAHALNVYRAQLRHYRDSGQAYEVQVVLQP